MQIVISSGHGKYVRGASGYIDEVDEARKVVNQVASLLKDMGTSATVFHDDVSKSQNENLNRIVNFHNSKTRDYDVSVHFNAYQTTSKAMGTEVLYVTQQALADKTVDAICVAGPFVNRGPKKRTDLFFLNSTEKPAILIETCFVDSKADVDIYKAKFTEVCRAIAETLSGKEVPVRPPIKPPTGVLFHAKGKCSHFGGPNDMGVSPSEGLAFIFEVDQAPHLFLPKQPPGTTGLARRLDPRVHYIACRWDYNVTPKETLRENTALVRGNGREFRVYPADWGPNETTGRIADLSPGLMEDLSMVTDDTVEVIYPFPEAGV